MNLGISNAETEKFIEKEDGDLNINFIGVSPSNFINHF